MGKGDRARNCHSEEFRDGYDAIDWSKHIRKPKTPPTRVHTDDAREAKKRHCRKQGYYHGLE